MNLRGAKRIKYGQSAWVTGVPTFWYSILFCSFYVYITDTNFTSLDKQSSFADTLSTPAETAIVLYYDFTICNIKKQLAGKGSYTYKMLCLISVFRTVHHWSQFRTKQMLSTHSKTTSSKYIPILSFH